MLSVQQKAYVRHKANQKVAKMEGREAMSDPEWCKSVGLHYNTAVNYRNNPEVQAAIDAEIGAAAESKDYYKYVLRRASLEELDKLYKAAPKNSAEKRHLLKMILEETADAVESREATDYSAFSDEDLEAIIFSKQTSAFGKLGDELAALRADIKGESWNSSSESEQPSSPESQESDCSDTPTDSAGEPETSSPKPKATRKSRSKKKKSPTR